MKEQDKDSTNLIEVNHKVRSWFWKRYYRLYMHTTLNKVGCYPTRKDGEFNVDDTFIKRIFNSEELVDLEILFYPTVWRPRII